MRNNARATVVLLMNWWLVTAVACAESQLSDLVDRWHWREVDRRRQAIGSLIAAGQFDEARAILDEEIQRSPEPYRETAQRARQLLDGVGSSGDAVKSTSALSSLVHASIALRAWESAVVWLERLAANRDPRTGDDSIQVAYPWCLAEAGKVEAAIGEYEKRLESARQRPNPKWSAYYEAQLAWLRVSATEGGVTGFVGRVRGRYLSGSEVGQDWIGALWALTGMLEQTWQAKDRRVLFEAIMECLNGLGDVRAVVAWENRARVEFANDDAYSADLELRAVRRISTNSTEYLPALRAVCERYPNTPAGWGARLELAQRLEGRGEFEAAILEGEKLLNADEPSSVRERWDLSGKKAVAAWLISGCYFKLGRYAEALAATQRAATKYRFPADCGLGVWSEKRRYQLREALCLGHLGRFDEAVAIYFEHATCGWSKNPKLARRLVDLYEAAGQLADLERSLNRLDDEYAKQLSDHLPPEARKQFESHRPSEVVRRVMEIRRWGAERQWEKLISLLKSGGPPMDHYGADVRESHWEAVEAARALAKAPAETTPLLVAILKEPGRGFWPHYALGLCGTEEAVAVLVAEARASDNWDHVAAVVYSLSLAGERGRRALEELAVGARANLALAIRRLQEGQLDGTRGSETQFPPIPEGLRLPKQLPKSYD
ncbi:MAG: hypothetical protein RMM51_10690 [Verrucomicrobiae bacterium]|nr:hypothetical protein [Verrucomicrobiae bacterium]